MTYIDCITVAIQNVNDLEIPPALMPLTISNAAAVMAGIDSDQLRGYLID